MFSNYNILTFFEDTLSERITSVTTQTGAHWGVTDNMAIGTSSTGSYARVLTLLIDTC